MESKSVWEDLALFLLRVITGGALFLGHGLGKFNRLLEGHIQFSDPIGLGPVLSFYLVVFAEFLCSILVVLGLFTRLAVVPIVITMLVVVFVVQIRHPFNKIELPLLFLMSSIVILLLGPGRFSLDARRKKLW